MAGVWSGPDTIKFAPAVTDMSTSKAHRNGGQMEAPSADEEQLGHYLRSVWPSGLSLEARANLLALYRGIAGASGARSLPTPHPEIPEAWLERNAKNEILGVGGLSRWPTPHEIGSGRRTLYAWCAFDCMFLPGVLGIPLEIRSACPVSGAEIFLRVSTETVERVSPPNTVISFVTPDAAVAQRDLRRVFCRHVRFYQSAGAAASKQSAGITLLTPRLAHRLGAIRNRTVFGDILGSDPR